MQPKHGGVPVGAFVVAPRQVQSVRQAVADAGWLKTPGRNVTPHHEQEADGKRECAVHVSQQAACALGRSTDIPSQIASLLASGVARWVPGLRVRSAACAASSPPPAPPQSTVAKPRTPNEAIPSDWPFKYIELFAGIGGYRVALDHLGGKCVFASELSKESRSTYHAAFGDMPHGDITEVETAEIADHDLLTAGFPSQTFSQAGEGAGIVVDLHRTPN